jgi:hypothetical protein
MYNGLIKWRNEVSAITDQEKKDAYQRFLNQSWDQLVQTNVKAMNVAIAGGAAQGDLVQMLMHNTITWKEGQKLTDVQKIAQIVQQRRKAAADDAC